MWTEESTEESGENEYMGECYKVLIVQLYLGRVRDLLKCSNRSIDRLDETELQERLKCAANGAMEENHHQRTSAILPWAKVPDC